MAAGSRDIVGYGAHSPTLPWPGGAKLAISLVVNYEEGSERSFAPGDPDRESLTEWGSHPEPGLLLDDPKMALARRNGAR